MLTGCGKDYNKLSYTKYNEYFKSKDGYVILDKTSNYDYNITRYLEAGNGNVQVFFTEYQKTEDAKKEIEDLYKNQKNYKFKEKDNYTYVKNTKGTYFKLYRVDNVVINAVADKKYKNVGDLKEQSLEQINELNPDLIIASKRQEKMIDKFKEIAPVFNVENDYTNYYPSFQQNVTALGQIFGKENVAKEKLSALDSKVAQVAKDAQSKTALLVLVNESKISAFGDGSRYGMVYQKFGFKPIDDSIKSSTHGQSVGFEYILEKNPDFLLVVDRTAAITEKANNAQKVLDNDIIKQTKAYKDGHIVYLDAANWYLAFGGLESMEIIAQELDRAVKK